MRIVAIVQARYDSRRLPGKALQLLAGKPMLGHVIEALRHARSIDAIALATSAMATDDPLANFARTESIGCYRGSLDDVAGRMLEAAREFAADAFVRVNGDSPLMDPALIDRGADLMRANPAADIVSNVFPRSFPKGQSVEVLRTDALDRAVRAMTRPEEREHVTPYFYANADRLKIVSFQAEDPKPEMQLSIDTPEDRERCEAILERLAAPAWRAGWRVCASVADGLDGASR